MNFSSAYVSWVDLFVLIFLIIGLRRGQKRGISEELLDLAKWCAVIGLSGLCYQFFGELLVSTGLFSLLYCYVAAYLLLMVAVLIVFSLIRKAVGDKLVESDAFGRGEYPLGMAAGVLRYAAMLVVGLSLLNARYYSPTERQALTDYQMKNYGSEFFPSLADVQVEVFGRSVSGKFTEAYLYPVMISPTAATDTKLNRSPKVRARENAVNEILAR